MILNAEPELAVAGQFDYLVGKVGTTTTLLRPGGKAEFGDALVDVISRGELIERGARVIVIEARGSHVLVAEWSDEGACASGGLDSTW